MFFPLSFDEFDFLTCYEMMPEENICSNLISWCNFFSSEEFSDLEPINFKYIINVFLEKINLENFLTWMKALQDQNNLPPEIFLSYLVSK